jgi:hypothetical protein
MNSKFRHPNVVLLYGIYEDVDYGLGVVVELAHNGTLKSFLKLPATYGPKHLTKMYKLRKHILLN